MTASRQRIIFPSSIRRARWQRLHPSLTQPPLNGLSWRRPPVINRDSGSAASCRFCCRSLLLACADNDSIALTRFAAEADDDGAAEARAGTALLRVPAR